MTKVVGVRVPPPAPAGRAFRLADRSREFRDKLNRRHERVAAMQVTETAAEGLKREFQVVVPATDLEARVNERLDDLKGQVRFRGFRPGKVPVEHLRRLYGKSPRWPRSSRRAVREANTQDRQRPRLQARHRAESQAAGGAGEVERSSPANRILPIRWSSKFCRRSRSPISRRSSWSARSPR